MSQNSFQTERMKVDGMDATKETSIEAHKMCGSIRKIGGWLHSAFRKGIGDASVKTS